jgi:hypothetical protein
VLDADGRTIAIGDDYLLCGKVARIEGADTVLLNLDGKHVLRAQASELLRVDDIVTRAKGQTRFFLTEPAAGIATPTGPNDYMRKTDVEAANSVQNALFLAIIAGYQPLDSDLSAIAALSTTTYGRSLLTAANAAGAAALTKAPYVLEQLAAGSVVGASTTDYQTLFEFVIPANALGTHGRATLAYDVKIACASGATKARWQVNGTDVWRAQNNLPATDGVARHIIGDASFVAAGTTASQSGSFHAHLSDQAITAGGVGGWLFDDGRMAGAWSTTAADSTADISIALQVQFVTANAGNYMQRRSARVIIEPTA